MKSIAINISKNIKSIDINKTINTIKEFGLKKHNLSYILFFPVFLIYLEMLTRFFLKKSSGGAFMSYIYILLFSMSAGLLLYALCSLFKSVKLNKIIANTLIISITLIYLTQIILNNTFNSFFNIDFMIKNSSNMFSEYTWITIKVIVRNLGIILLFSVPIVLFNIPYISRKIEKATSSVRIKISAVLTSLILQSVAICIIMSPLSGGVERNGLPSDKGIYSAEYEINMSISRFGMLTSLRLDLKHLMFGRQSHLGGVVDGGNILALPNNEEIQQFNSTMTDTLNSKAKPNNEKPQFIPQNQIDPKYDFAALAKNETDPTLKDMNEYFAEIEPTQTNKYTGMFEDKNLIFLTLEAFTPFMVCEELTPTLHMMMNSGFVFKNYYQPAWGGATSTGEFSALMGLFPDGGQAMQDTIGKDLSFTIGNRLKSRGYTSYAFHSNNHEYYSRDKTHKGLGYAKFLAPGSGLDNLTPAWPPSDLDLFEKTIDYYIDKQPFSVYYMTLSGHSIYTKANNGMAEKNWHKVENLPYSDTIKAYIACNLELEYAMRFLLNTLEEAGILDNTVIVATNDHFPYGLETPIADSDYISELIAGIPNNNFDRKFVNEFEKHRSALFLWSSSINEPIIIEKPSYSLDILPTLLNLFGETFDSRLFTGRDLLSDSPGIAIFPNYNWISEAGSFDSKSGEFTPMPGFEKLADNEYVDTMKKVVRNRIAYGKSILQNDYFGYLNRKME